MMNDEIQKKLEFQMTNHPASCVGIRHSNFVILSSFVICHSSFLAFCFTSAFAAAPAQPDFAQVNAIFAEHCLDCHAANEPEGQLVLESFETLMKGGEIGPAVVAGKNADSLLVQI